MQSRAFADGNWLTKSQHKPLQLRLDGRLWQMSTYAVGCQFEGRTCTCPCQLLC